MLQKYNSVFSNHIQRKGQFSFDQRKTHWNVYIKYQETISEKITFSLIFLLNFHRRCFLKVFFFKFHSHSSVEHKNFKTNLYLYFEWKLLFQNFIVLNWTGWFSRKRWQPIYKDNTFSFEGYCMGVQLLQYILNLVTSTLTPDSAALDIEECKLAIYTSLANKFVLEVVTLKTFFVSVLVLLYQYVIRNALLLRNNPREEWLIHTSCG